MSTETMAPNVPALSLEGLVNAFDVACRDRELYHVSGPRGEPLGRETYAAWERTRAALVARVEAMAADAARLEHMRTHGMVRTPGDGRTMLPDALRSLDALRESIDADMECEAWYTAHPRHSRPSAALDGARGTGAGV